MKKIIFVFVFCFSFFGYGQESWREWQSTNCYEKIDFRIKYEDKYGSRHQWSIQFKNEYDQAITFNYAITEEEQDFLTNHRKSLQAGEVSQPVTFYTQTKDFFVLVDKLSFSLYQEEFVPCDPQ